MQGVIVLAGKNSIELPRFEFRDTPPFMLVLETGDKLFLFQDGEDNEIMDFAKSPDKRWLTYYVQHSGVTGSVYVVSNDGTLSRRYSVDDWWNILDWLDNNRLFVTKFSGQNPYSTLIFNPFTGNTEQELSPNYPNIFAGYSGELSTWGEYQLSETVYSTDLSMVVYPKSPNSIVLWDVGTQKEIAEINDLSAASHAPIWLSNGKEFIVDITFANTPDRWYQDELVSVNPDGRIKQLTNLADLPYKNVSIQNFSKSADGRYIAFWFVQINSGPSRLALYDSLKEDTKVFCSLVGGYLPPVWSPYGYQLIVDGTFDKLENYGAIFIDVNTQTMAQIENGVVPFGWMISP